MLLKKEVLVKDSKVRALLDYIHDGCDDDSESTEDYELLEEEDIEDIKQTKRQTPKDIKGFRYIETSKDVKLMPLNSRRTIMMPLRVKVTQQGKDVNLFVSIDTFGLILFLFGLLFGSVAIITIVKNAIVIVYTLFLALISGYGVLVGTDKSITSLYRYIERSFTVKEVETLK